MTYEKKLNKLIIEIQNLETINKDDLKDVEERIQDLKDTLSEIKDYKKSITDNNETIYINTIENLHMELQIKRLKNICNAYIQDLQKIITKNRERSR